MPLLEIIKVPHPVLRKKARKVTDFGPEFQDLVKNMIDTMRDAPGVGLAAPQVAVSERLIVVEYGDEEDETVPSKLYVVANPEIAIMSNLTVKGIEGCLSVPDLIGEVERFDDIQIRGLNSKGKPIRIKAKGWLARIFQHEIDHLDGIVYTDRAEKVWTPGPQDEIPLD
jgi:peptide deformylase